VQNKTISSRPMFRIAKPEKNYSIGEIQFNTILAGNLKIVKFRKASGISYNQILQLENHSSIGTMIKEICICPKKINLCNVQVVCRIAFLPRLPINISSL